MSDEEAATAEALRIHQFAEQTLSEIATRAEEDGIDGIALHTAFAMASIAWLANQLGTEKVQGFLEHLVRSIEPPDNQPH
jgi:hypothetical protein